MVNRDLTGGSMTEIPGNDKLIALCKRMKKRAFWILNEAIALMSPDADYLLDEYNGPGMDEFLETVICEIDTDIFIRAIQTGRLIVIKGWDENSVKNWDSRKSTPINYSKDENFYNCRAELWRDCYGHLEIDPFNFLELVKEKKLYKIPYELRYGKTVSESGETKYFWLSDVIPATNEQNEMIDQQNEFVLSGQERRELGRLRAEKNKLKTIRRVTLKVGEFISQKRVNGEKIIRKDVSDFIYSLDKNFPDTQIDSIWRDIEDDYKKGPGRPKKNKNIN